MSDATLPFVIVAALLSVAVLGRVLWPVWRGPRWPLGAAVASLSVVVLGLYVLVGTPQALRAPAAAEAPRTLQEAVARLEEELQRNPDAAEGWALLGRSRAALGDQAGARDAYARAVALAPDEPGLLVDAAEARALADPERRFDEQALAWLRRALELQPGHQRATWFLGVAQRQAGRAAEAAATWEPLLATVDAATARSLREQIDAARADAGLPPLQAEAAPATALRVRLMVPADLAARTGAREDAAVFVIARIPGGPPMPVAVERHPLRDLPAEVVLDDRDSPMPTQKLSALDEVEVLARLSLGGSAGRGEGDIESPPVRVRLPAQAPVELRLDAAR
ncbi:MAG: cytochrome C biogenesis protein [Lysobacteraceae bacterium]